MPKTKEVGAPLTFHHDNGWTMSVNHNIGPGYSVIAYPTKDGFDTDRHFKFENGQSEGWCASLSGLVTLAQEVMNALPPRLRYAVRHVPQARATANRYEVYDTSSLRPVEAFRYGNRESDRARAMGRAQATRDDMNAGRK